MIIDDRFCCFFNSLDRSLCGASFFSTTPTISPIGAVTSAFVAIFTLGFGPATVASLPPPDLLDLEELGNVLLRVTVVGPFESTVLLDTGGIEGVVGLSLFMSGSSSVPYIPGSGQKNHEKSETLSKFIAYLALTWSSF